MVKATYLTTFRSAIYAVPTDKPVAGCQLSDGTFESDARLTVRSWRLHMTSANAIETRQAWRPRLYDGLSYRAPIDSLIEPGTSIRHERDRYRPSAVLTKPSLTFDAYFDG